MLISHLTQLAQVHSRIKRYRKIPPNRRVRESASTSSSGPQEFHKFSLLPVRVRALIWELVPAARLITLSVDIFGDLGVWDIRIEAAPIITLTICSESRHNTLKNYTRIKLNDFGMSADALFLVNFARDTFYLDLPVEELEDTGLNSYRSGNLHGFLEANFSRIQSLVLSYHWVEDLGRRQFLNMFTDLKMIALGPKRIRQTRRIGDISPVLGRMRQDYWNHDFITGLDCYQELCQNELQMPLVDVDLEEGIMKVNRWMIYIYFSDDESKEFCAGDRKHMSAFQAEATSIGIRPPSESLLYNSRWPQDNNRIF